MARMRVFALLLVFNAALPEAAFAQTNLRGLVVLIDFSDVPATMPVGRANNIINGDRYTEPTATKSLRDYYLAQSRGDVPLARRPLRCVRDRRPHRAGRYGPSAGALTIK